MTTLDRWKKILPVIQAYTEGKPVQYKDRMEERWFGASTPNFNPELEWRIKPEPREFFAQVYKNGFIRMGALYLSRGAAEGDNNLEHEIIKLREVI